MVALGSKGTAVVTTPSDTQILITREFAAPRHAVFRVLTEPELIKRWWSGGFGEVDRDALLASGMEAGVQAGYDLLEEIAISLR